MRRTSVRQGPQGREFSRRLVPDRAAAPRAVWPSTASCAPPTTSPTMPTRRAGGKAAPAGRDARQPGGRKRCRRPKAWRCATCWRSAACRRSMRSTCWKPSAATSPSCAIADWDDLMDYCRYSAMPVGRFVLDVHGESREPVAGQRRAVRRAAGDQSPAGLRQGLPRAGPGLYPRGRAGRGRRSRSRRWARPRPVPALRGVIADLARRNARSAGHIAALRRADPGRAACAGSRS